MALGATGPSGAHCVLPLRSMEGKLGAKSGHNWGLWPVTPFSQPPTLQLLGHQQHGEPDPQGWSLGNLGRGRLRVAHDFANLTSPCDTVTSWAVGNSHSLQNVSL